MNINNVKLLFVQITPECNLDCSYCPFSKLNTTMNRQNNFEKQIDSLYIILNSTFFEKSFDELVIYGGEPLLYFNQVKKVIKEYRKHKKGGKVTICTNGIFINKAIISFCKGEMLNLAINMDGDFDIVKNIKSVSKISWSNLLENLTLLRSKNIPFDFSTTLTPSFIKNFDAQIKFLESLHPRMIGFNFLRDEQSQKKLKVKDYNKYFIDSMSLVFNYNSKFNFNRIKKLSAYKNNRQAPDCVCSGLGLTVLANGEYTTCGIFPSQKCKTIEKLVELTQGNNDKLFSSINLKKDIINPINFWWWLCKAFTARQ